MAIVSQAQYSTMIQTIIDEISSLNCEDGSQQGPIIINNYFQQLKKKYNKKILCNCLSKVIDKVDDMYYNDGTSPWSDLQYDLFVDYLKKNSSGYFVDSQLANKISDNNIGAQVNNVGSNTATTVKLPYFMASMNKYKKISEVKNWCNKFRGPYTISAKLDGVSAMYYRGKLYTRGNGVTGRDISYLIPFLKQKLPDKSFECGLRGELIIRRSTFSKKYADTFANSRNLVCGLLNRLYNKDNEQYYSNIDFIVYDVYHYNPLQFFNKIKIVNDCGSQMVIYKDKIDKSQLDNLELLNTILKTWKNDYDYEIDGIIITSNKPCIHSNDSNPDFAFAYKNNVIGVEIKEAVVDKVLWNLSKDNYWKPKIKLTEKVDCDGSQVEYVTGFNAKYILQNNIKSGTIVKIGLSGNVIPHIFEIVENDKCEWDWEDLTHPNSKQILENIDSDIDFCEWSKNKVDLLSKNSENHASTIKKNMVFFNSFEIKCGLQETTLINLYNSLDIYKLWEVLSLTVEEWEQVEKVGTKKGQKIVNSLKEALDWNLLTQSNNNIGSLSEMYFMNCMVGFQSFPRGFGKKKLDCHMVYLKKNCSSVDKLYDLSYFKKLQSILSLNIEKFKTPQVTADSVELFCQGYIDFLNMYDDVKTKTKNIEFPSSSVLLSNIQNNNNSSNNYTSSNNNVTGGNGFNVVFSGVRNKDKENEYIKKGYQISDSVNSKTKILIVKDKNANTTKIKKAKALGVKIASLNEI